MNWQDNLISFFLGVIVVIIFGYMFESPCVVINSSNPKYFKHIVRNDNKCHELNLKKVDCPYKVKNMLKSVANVKNV